MASIAAFQKLADMVVGAKARQTKEHQAFLETYRGIVETVPLEAAKAFGTLENILLVRDGSKEESCGLLLTAADYAFWDRKVAAGWRVKRGTDLLLSQMAERLAKAAEGDGLEPQQRKELIDNLIVISGTTASVTWVSA